MKTATNPAGTTTMRITQINNKATFLEKARELGLKVRVLRMPTVVPRLVDGKVTMKPAVQLFYQLLRYDQEHAGEEEHWHFTEYRFADADGLVELGDTLWAELSKKDAVVPMVLLHRSGSF